MQHYLCLYFILLPVVQSFIYLVMCNPSNSFPNVMCCEHFATLDMWKIWLILVKCLQKCLWTFPSRWNRFFCFFFLFLVAHLEVYVSHNAVLTSVAYLTVILTRGYKNKLLTISALLPYGTELLSRSVSSLLCNNSCFYSCHQICHGQHLEINLLSVAS